MDVKNIDVCQNLHEMTWQFCLSTELWIKYQKEQHNIDLNNMSKIKYFGKDSSKLSKEVNNIPNDKGGIYIYTLENPILSGSGKYIMYVGRALLTENENLRKRVQSHFQQYKKEDENERLIRLYDNWAPFIHLLYIPIDNNDDIKTIEEELIVVLTPPCNKQYPSIKIRKKLSAFQYS